MSTIWEVTVGLAKWMFCCFIFDALHILVLVTNLDGKYEEFRLKKKAGDPNKRAFTYFVLGGARFLYATSGWLKETTVFILPPLVGK